MATRTNTPDTRSRRRPASPAILPAKTVFLASHLGARAPILPADQVYRPTRLQFALAYLRNGDAPPMFGLPPIALDDLAIFAFNIAACLALGVLLGSAIV